MNHRPIAAKNPVVGVDAFDAHAGLVAGDDIGGAQHGERRVALFLEGRRRARKHVHQRALAQCQPEEIEKQPLQPLVGHRLPGLHVNRQRMDARPERRADGGRRQHRLRLLAAAGATDRVAPMAAHEGPYGRQFDLVVFADQQPLGFRPEGGAAAGAMCRRMIFESVRRAAEFSRMPFMSGLRPAGRRIFPLLLAVGRRRFRGRARGLVRPLHPQHQIDQLFLGKAFQISAIHPRIESPNELCRKGVGNCRSVSCP